MACPVCKYPYVPDIKFITCESFDNSRLYKDIAILKCKRCGHIFNDLYDEEIEELYKYYEEEYAPINLSAKDETDRPGSENKTTTNRYIKLYLFIFDVIEPESRILDIGCASGGFLDFLKVKGHENLYGIEPVESYVKKANNDNIKVGSVYSIPFPDNSFDLVILDQVLEHLWDLESAMKEIMRVLDVGGMCCISVPDSDRYDEELYWYLIREHIQHFNLKSIKLLTEKNGFELIKIKKTKNKMIGNIYLPNLSVILKKRSEIYCWGIGREFMYLYPNTRLNNLDLILVDDTPEKQKRTFKGMKIHSSDILKEASENSFLIITALVHKQTLIKKAKEIGYKGVIIDV